MEKNPKVFVIPPLSYSLCELGQHIRAFGVGLSWFWVMQTRTNDSCLYSKIYRQNFDEYKVIVFKCLLLQ